MSLEETTEVVAVRPTLFKASFVLHWAEQFCLECLALSLVGRAEKILFFQSEHVVENVHHSCGKAVYAKMMKSVQVLALGLVREVLATKHEEIVDDGLQFKFFVDDMAEQVYEQIWDVECGIRGVVVLFHVLVAKRKESFALLFCPCLESVVGEWIGEV